MANADGDPVGTEIGTTLVSTVAAPSPAAASASDAASIIKTAVSSAVSNAANGGTVTTALTALANGLTGLEESLIGVAGGPIAGDVSKLVVPEVNGILVTALSDLYAHIGKDIPAGLKSIIEKL